MLYKNQYKWLVESSWSIDDDDDDDDEERDNNIL